MKKIALIPARSLSKRIPNKNIKLLGEHPLLAYSICSAIESKIFDKVVCVTDSSLYAEIASYYGAEVPMLRPKEISTDESSDIDWINWILLDIYKDLKFDVYSILRPTSPFRTKDTILKAFKVFQNLKDYHSLRAIQKVSEHPGKMWINSGGIITPLLPFKNGDVNWHSCQSNTLPEVFIQNASLEISWTKVLIKQKSISGSIIYPFISENQEGFDINNTNDWYLAQKFIQENNNLLPRINKKPFKIKNSIKWEI